MCWKSSSGGFPQVHRYHGYTPMSDFKSITNTTQVLSSIVEHTSTPLNACTITTIKKAYHDAISLFKIIVIRNVTIKHFLTKT